MLRLGFLLVYAVAAFAEPNVTFIAIGDWGLIGAPQDMVAEAMDMWSATNKPQFILTTGDNFYPDGVSSVDDPGWDTKWRDVYYHDNIGDLPWNSALGNHDYGQGQGNGEEWVQVYYHELDVRWNMPHLWYTFHKSIGEVDVHFIMLDTEALFRERNNHLQMMQFLEDELAGSSSEWKIVVGHRHIYSSGPSGPITDVNWDSIRPLLEQYNADVYLCGHAHNLQHLQNIVDVDVDYVVSGGGGGDLVDHSAAVEEQLNNDYGVQLNYFAMDYGFVGFVITETEMLMEIINGSGETLYTYTRYRASH